MLGAVRALRNEEAQARDSSHGPSRKTYSLPISAEIDVSSLEQAG